MTLIQAVLLATVEGLTEFLPVSSTGHQILLSNFFGIGTSEFVKSFEIFVQLGAVLAVVFIYRQTLFQKITLWPNLLIAFLPSGLVGLILYKWVKSYLLGNSYIVLTSLLVGGIVLILVEKFLNTKDSSQEEISKKQALLIGVFQTLSIIPGVSRSAATIVGGLFNGLSRKEAVEFSFLLSIPTIAAASGLDLLKSNLQLGANEYFLLSVGFLVSFLTAIVAIKFFLKYVSNHSLTVFGVYRILIALILWLTVFK